jgi:putative hemolysin
MRAADVNAPQTWEQQSESSSWYSRLLASLSGMNPLHSIYKSIGPTQGPVEYATRALSAMRIDCVPSEQSLAHLPRSGRVIIVANHPCGALDGLAAIRVIGTRRSDVRVLANADLVSIAELTPLLLAVDPGIGRSDTARNAQALRKAWRWLVEEHALVVFPACGVAHFDTRAGCVTDPPWSPVIGRLVKQTASPVVPLHFAGRNSALFQLVGLLAPPLRTLLLRGELRRRRASRVDVHVGESIARERLGQFESPEALALHLRLRTLLAPTSPSISSSISCAASVSIRCSAGWFAHGIRLRAPHHCAHSPANSPCSAQWNRWRRSSRIWSPTARVCRCCCVST